MLVEGVRLLGIVAHGVLGAHTHELLRLIEFAALLSEAVEAVRRRNLAGVDAAVVGVLLIGKIYDVRVKQCSVLVIHTDAEGILFHHSLKLCALDNSLGVPVLQSGFRRLDARPAAFHKRIHPVFPGGGGETVGFLGKIPVKACPDAQNGVS